MKPQNWPTLLHEHIRDGQSKVFAWGAHDCALWSADWCVKMGHTDPAAQVRGSWGDARSAVKTMRALGGYENAVRSCMKTAGIAEVPPRRALRGDVALVRVKRRTAVGICDGLRVACLGKGAPRVEPRSSIVAAWRI